MREMSAAVERFAVGGAEHEVWKRFLVAEPREAHDSRGEMTH